MKTTKFNLNSYLKRGSKYGNTITQYKGRNYHSRKEAEWAIVMDDRLKLGEITDWKSQFTLKLDINNEHICNYIIDFWAITKDGLEELTEIKGFETNEWKIKWRLAQALYRDKYKFILIK